jgi:hypothetical protein
MWHTNYLEIMYNFADTVTNRVNTCNYGIKILKNNQNLADARIAVSASWVYYEISFLYDFIYSLEKTSSFPYDLSLFWQKIWHGFPSLILKNNYLSTKRTYVNKNEAQLFIMKIFKISIIQPKPNSIQNCRKKVQVL